VRGASLKLYKEAAAYAKERGIIIADTKFEFGIDDDGVLYLIDEALTPDSSRFLASRPISGWHQSTKFRQAIYPRLSGNAGLGQNRAGASFTR